MAPRLILASQSAARQALLDHAGIVFEAVPARIDEDMITQSLIADGANPRDVADTLAELKAQKIANKSPDAWVLGSDQVLSLKGQMFSKPGTPEDAKDHLAQLQGQTHVLSSAGVIYEDGKPIWRHVSQARMTMRALSPEFISDYVDTYWDHIRHCVGCYRAESEGIRLFSQIFGDPPTIQGLPLLPLLAFLSVRGMVPS